MSVMLDFMRCWLKMRQPWPLWLALLMLANGVAPLFFLHTAEGRVALVVFAVSAGAMMLLFSRFGWVRLLGSGHALWLWLVPWLWLRLGEIESDTPHYWWVTAVIALNSGSLALDLVHTAQWVAGRREPTVTLD